MADVRVTVGRRSREVGTQVGMQMNTFGLDRLVGISGDDLLPIVTESLEPAREQMVADWPVWTGASRDSIRIEAGEVGPKYARAVLTVGGLPLIEDPRNLKHIDYAPYIEFNGTATAPSGILLYAMEANRRAMRDEIHAKVSLLLQERLR